MANERKFITENIRRVLLKEYLMKEVERAGFGGLDIQRTPMGTRVTLFTERPGLVIGRKGEAIKTLTKEVEDIFKFNNPQIEVQEVETPSLNAQIMAQKLATALERGWHFRRAGHTTVRRIMDAGARGCQIIIAGKLTGERHRTEKFKEGTIKYCGESALKYMRKGYTVAKLKPGIMGVTVWIMDPNAKLPDDIEILIPKEEVKVEAPAKVEEVKAEIPKEEVKPELEIPKEKEKEKKAKPKAKKPKIEKKKLKKIAVEIKELEAAGVELDLTPEEIEPEEEGNDTTKNKGN